MVWILILYWHDPGLKVPRESKIWWPHPTFGDYSEGAAQTQAGCSELVKCDGFGGVGGQGRPKAVWVGYFLFYFLCIWIFCLGVTCTTFTPGAH